MTHLGLWFYLCINYVLSHKLNDVFTWKQLNYDINGVFYRKNENFERRPDGVYFDDELEERDKFFIQYNNVPIGFEYDGHRVFVTVPRRRHGIPSTLNYVRLGDKSPSLHPYAAGTKLISVYRPRIDVCQRLWMVDTGLLEVPGERQQVLKPSIVIFDLKTDKQILKHELKDSDLFSERTSGGLTSITVDVNKSKCNEAFAYITDLATNSIVVFSLSTKTTWRIEDPSFVFDETALNFTVAGHTISWPDGIFSLALVDLNGRTMGYYHPLMSTNEYMIDTGYLKNNSFQGNAKLLGNRGPKTQSGSHAYHEKSKTIFFANVANDAILCWNVETKMAPENVAIAAQDHEKLVYISDLKVIGDEVWVLVNQIPRFVFSTLDTKEPNYFIHRSQVKNLIRGTVCDRKY
ncbi:unnamed protein product [Pieris brassicae]|uniref:Yellow-f4 n=1 Tax=Pieris brassicae TaxID=7116 RepID=A0A9P0XEG3_PIEBR|nr:unnamed protein product [Pieris brassicae]